MEKVQKPASYTVFAKNNIKLILLYIWYEMHEATKLARLGTGTIATVAYNRNFAEQI